MTPRYRRRAPAACVTGLAFCLVACATEAHASGLFFSDRGVRPLGRGGAFVAGADDLGAIHYNPAGIADAPRQALADVGWLLFHSSYTRVARRRQVDPNTDEVTQVWDQTYPEAEGSAPLIPIPTLALSYDFTIPNTAFAIGAFAPYSAGGRYPERVGGEPNPGRYMLLNLDGSALIVTGLWGAYKFGKYVNVGAGFEMLLGQYRSQSVLSTCLPDRFICAPEDPAYDSVTQLEVGPIYAPGANVGIQIKPLHLPDDPVGLTIGGSFQTPFRVDAPAKVQVRIPSAPFFDRAQQQGDDARVVMDFPWIARAGVQVAFPQVRAEVAYVYEAWSLHENITVTPENIVLRDVELFPAEYRVRTITWPRNFKDAWSIRTGGETWFKVGSYQLDFRAGVMYETSAVPESYLSTLTIDLPKWIGSIGGSLHVSENWRFDWVVAHVFANRAHVRPENDDGVLQDGESALDQINPVRSEPPDYPNYINGGYYDASATILGVGMAVNYL